MFPQDIDLSFTVSTVSHDAQLTVLNDAIDGMALIHFLQSRPPIDGKQAADVVASVSFPNLVAFEKFVNDMQANLDQHKKRQKSKSA